VPPSFLLYDTRTRRVSTFQIDPRTKSVSEQPAGG